MEQNSSWSNEILYEHLEYLETRYNISRSMSKAEAQILGEMIHLEPQLISVWFRKNQRKKITIIPTEKAPRSEVLELLSRVAEEAKPCKKLKLTNLQNRALEELYMSERRNDLEAQTEVGKIINLPIRTIRIWFGNRKGNRGTQRLAESIGIGPETGMLILDTATDFNIPPNQIVNTAQQSIGELQPMQTQSGYSSTPSSSLPNLTTYQQVVLKIRKSWGIPVSFGELEALAGHLGISPAEISSSKHRTASTSGLPLALKASIEEMLWEIFEAQGDMDRLAQEIRLPKEELKKWMKNPKTQNQDRRKQIFNLKLLETRCRIDSKISLKECGFIAELVELEDCFVWEWFNKRRPTLQETDVHHLEDPDAFRIQEILKTVATKVLAQETEAITKVQHDELEKLFQENEELREDGVAKTLQISEYRVKRWWHSRSVFKKVKKLGDELNRGEVTSAPKDGKPQNAANLNSQRSTLEQGVNISETSMQEDSDSHNIAINTSSQQSILGLMSHVVDDQSIPSALNLHSNFDPSQAQSFNYHQTPGSYFTEPHGSMDPGFYQAPPGFEIAGYGIDAGLSERPPSPRNWAPTEPPVFPEPPHNNPVETDGMYPWANDHQIPSQQTHILPKTIINSESSLQNLKMQ